MLFLVSGASGAGKSTVREILSASLGSSFVAVELRDLDQSGPVSVRWRQETAEVAAQRAVSLSADGRHLLLSGDPVAPAEMVAAPSSSRIGGVATCLLDVSPRIQADRLARRGDDPAVLPAHLGFRRWMREHAHDPLSRLNVVTRDGSPAARWDRISRLVEQDEWHVHVIDTSEQDPHEVARSVATWIEDALASDNLVMHPSDSPDPATR